MSQQTDSSIGTRAAPRIDSMSLGPSPQFATPRTNVSSARPSPRSATNESLSQEQVDNGSALGELQESVACESVPCHEESISSRPVQYRSFANMRSVFFKHLVHTGSTLSERRAAGLPAAEGTPTRPLNSVSFSDVGIFMNNDMSHALHQRKLRSRDRDKCLKRLGFGKLGTLSPSRRWSRMSDGSLRGTAQEIPTISEEVIGRLRGFGTQAPGLMSETTLTSVESMPSELDYRVASLARCFFENTTTEEHVQSQHVELGKVTRKIFALEEHVQQLLNPTRPTTVELSYTDQLEVAAAAVRSLRTWAGYLCSSWLFSTCFFLLTFYTLFFPDLAVLLGNRHTDGAVLWANTAVFGFFVLELFIFLVGRQGYICSTGFLLDIICLVSIVADTVLMEMLEELLSVTEHDDDGGSGLGGAVIFSCTGSTMPFGMEPILPVRLLRIARVAKLVPHFLRLLRRQNFSVGQTVLLRRLWRVFKFLDRSSSGLISAFDIKCFYLITLQECPEMMSRPKEELLKADIGPVRHATQIGRDEHDVKLNFDKFSQVVLHTRMGQEMRRYHVQELEKERGIWDLTMRLSDSLALKVCAGIIFFVAATSFLMPSVTDMSAERGLEQLQHIAEGEHEQGAFDSSYLCSQIRLYAQAHKVLFLRLAGRTYLDGGGECLLPGIAGSSTEGYEQVRNVVEQSSLRQSELVLSCLPSCGEGCSQNATSIALIDEKAEAMDEVIRRLLMTAAVVALLFIFILALNSKITKFSRAVLQPLRWLMDDMLAMSSLDLLDMDKDMPELHPPAEDCIGSCCYAEEKVEEMENFQSAFRYMQSAIRSWSLYVPPSVVQMLVNSGLEASIGVSKCDATILFCDIEGFEEICHGMDTECVIEVLGNVLEKIAEVIQIHSGTLLEFIGDEVLAIFNAPQALAHHTRAAVLACEEIHTVMEEQPPFICNSGRSWKLQCRCGVHTGRLLVGNIGSGQRMKYGALGDVINLAARLKGLNTRYHTRTLTTSTVLRKLDVELLQTRIISRPVDLVAVKGKQEPTTVYEIMRGPVLPEARDAAQKHREAFRLYRNHKFKDALELLQEAEVSLNTVGQPPDFPNQLLRRRCEKYLMEPPEPEWDGVDRLQTKHFFLEGASALEQVQTEPIKAVLDDEVDEAVPDM